MKLLSIVLVYNAMRNQGTAAGATADTLVDYSGYKVLVANWTDASVTGDVEKILLSYNADIWSDWEDLYEQKCIRFMASGNLAPSITSVLRNGSSIGASRVVRALILALMRLGHGLGRRLSCEPNKRK